MKHEYKCVSPYFEDFVNGKKPFEVRIDDRIPKPQAGDEMRLRHWDEQKQEYLGSEIDAPITYALRDPRFVKAGFVILGSGDVEGHYP